MLSPTARTLQRLRDVGYLVAGTQHWNPHAKIRQDLFGIVDVLAVKPGQTLAVQATSSSNASKRQHKLQDHESLHPLLSAGWLVEVWGWRKNSSNRWVVRRIRMGKTPEQTRVLEDE